MNLRAAVARPLLTATNWLAGTRPAPAHRTERREWWSYFGAFGDDIFDDD